VKAMVTEKFVGMFNMWQLELERLGYANFAQVLNAKDYGVPQNRERIFLVSIRMDGLQGLAGDVRYYFPKPFPLERRLKDVLEENVDERYYLSDRMIETFLHRNEINEAKGNGFRFTPTKGEGYAHSILTCPGQRPDDNFIEDETEENGRQATCQDASGREDNATLPLD
jgi:DNA (cytosine-5)-methyltransferase 1